MVLAAIRTYLDDCVADTNAVQYDNPVRLARLEDMVSSSSVNATELCDTIPASPRGWYTAC